MVCLIWDFLSRDPTSLGSFVFYLFDEKRVNYLERKEITELITVLHHTNIKKYKRGVQHIVDDICNECGEVIDVIKFDNYCKQNFFICGPITGLQESLRNQILVIIYL